MSPLESDIWNTTRDGISSERSYVHVISRAEIVEETVLDSPIIWLAITARP